MTLGLPIAAATVAAVAAVLAGLTALAYVLKMRRRRFEVPFSTLWQRVLRETDASSLWKQLRRLLSLLLALFILALLLMAVLDPRLGDAERDAAHVVVILDASASMKAADGTANGERTRMEVAKEKAHAALSAMGAGDAAMIVRMDGQTTPLSRFDSDKPLLHRLIDGITASDTPADLRRALAAAADALHGRKNPMILLIGDGAYPQPSTERILMGASDEAEAQAATSSLDAIDLRGIDVRFVPVGTRANNVGIVAFNVRRYLTNKMSYEVFIEVQNFGSRRTAAEVIEAVATVYGTSSAELLAASGDATARTLAMYLAQEKTRQSPRELAAAFGLDDPAPLGAAYRTISSALTADGDEALRGIIDDIEERLRQAPARRKLILYSGELPIDVREIELAPGERLQQLYPELGGGQDHRLRAVLEPIEGEDGDSFALDDEAFALLPRQAEQTVLLVTEDNLYLEGAMLVYENVVVDKLPPAEYAARVASGAFDDYDIVVFDDYTPERLPGDDVHALYFHPRGDHAPFTIRRTLSQPRITEVNEDHPVMRWILMNDVNFDAADVYALERDEAQVWLLRSVRDVVAAARRDGARKIAAFGFSLAGTDLTLRVSFPLLLVNVLDWFAGDDSDLITTYTTGRRFRVPLDGTSAVHEAQVRTPSGKTLKAPLVAGSATFYGNEVGLHTLTARADDDSVARIELAANLANPAESAIAPRRELTLGGMAVPPPEAFAIRQRQSLWRLLILAATALLLLEWVTYHRRITV